VALTEFTVAEASACTLGKGQGTRGTHRFSRKTRGVIDARVIAARIFRGERRSFGWYQFVVSLSGVIWWRSDTVARLNGEPRYLEVTPGHNGNKALFASSAGVLFHSVGGQAALFVMHFDPRRSHLEHFSLPRAFVAES